jgi:hypothetical protein
VDQSLSAGIAEVRAAGFVAPRLAATGCIAAGCVALWIAGCGGAPAPRAEPAPVAAPAPAAEPASPPRPHRIAVRTFLPVAPTAAGLDSLGTWMCRQTWYAAPAEDAAHCVGEGLGIAAAVLHTIDPEGAVSTYLERPVELRRLRDCGNFEERVRRPTRALLERAAPDLASAEASSAVLADRAHFASCETTALDILVDGEIAVAQRGSIARLEAASGEPTIRLVRGDSEIARWTLDAIDAGACADDAGTHVALALEALCAGDVTVITAASTIPPSACADRSTVSQLESLPCAPDPSVHRFRELARWRIDTASGEVTPLPIAQLRFDPAAR